MNPVHPLFAVIIYAIAFASAFILSLRYKIVNNQGRFETIDGLRGFLAMGVFIHHSSIWYQFLHTGKWDNPPSKLYTHFGQTSVALFFMITSFLFISKLVASSEKGMDWKSFFVGRFYRLTPNYIYSLSLIVLIVFAVSGWQLRVSGFEFMKQLFHWGTFTVLSYPDINGYADTTRVNAGVVWSLPYEWLFYFCMPILALLILKKKQNLAAMLISVVFIALFALFHGIDIQHLLSFAGGAIAPFILKYKKRAFNFRSVYISAIVVACFALVILFPSTSRFFCKLLIIVAFTLIALGNNVFGILQNRTLKFLGEISYSTYLLHGIVLFCVIEFFVGKTKASELSEASYCNLIFLITPLVVATSALCYHFIEKPFLAFGKRRSA